MIRGAVGALWVCCGHAASVLWSCYGRGAGVLWDCCPDGGANPSQLTTEMPIQVGSGAVGVVVVVVVVGVAFVVVVIAVRRAVGVLWACSGRSAGVL